MDSNKIKETVNSIEMSKSMSDRMKSNLQNKGQKRYQPFLFNKWRSVTSVLAVLLLLVVGVNQYGNSSNSKFVITAYADNGISHELLKEKATFDLVTMDRIGVINSISGGGNDLIFTDVLLQVSGENIDTIQYEINRGAFIEDVILTNQEFNNKEQLRQDKINYITTDPNSNIHQAIKEIGNTFTVKYSEQAQTKYSLAVPPHNSVEDNIVIKVTVTYTDGDSEQQKIVVNQELDSISLVLDK